MTMMMTTTKKMMMMVVVVANNDDDNDDGDSGDDDEDDDNGDYTALVMGGVTITTTITTTLYHSKHMPAYLDTNVHYEFVLLVSNNVIQTRIGYHQNCRPSWNNYTTSGTKLQPETPGPRRRLGQESSSGYRPWRTQTSSSSAVGSCITQTSNVGENDHWTSHTRHTRFTLRSKHSPAKRRAVRSFLDFWPHENRGGCKISVIAYRPEVFAVRTKPLQQGPYKKDRGPTSPRTVDQKYTTFIVRKVNNGKCSEYSAREELKTRLRLSSNLLYNESSRRKFVRIRPNETFHFRSNTWKYETGNRASWLVEFLYQPSQELSDVIRYNRDGLLMIPRSIIEKSASSLLIGITVNVVEFVLAGQQPSAQLKEIK